MLGALIILVFTLFTGLLLWITHKPDTPGSETSAETENAAEPADGCCGMHEVCEKFPVDKPVYFDDEELDAYKGRKPDEYTPDEIEAFRDVLYTLLPQDLAPWGLSITARGIEMPSPIRDEWVMLVNETSTRQTES
ncbi:MAG: phospholipase [Duncaniella sp.]|nr:phospholipase [Duncaniella sp.]HBI57459.1 hypothetical protein [Porphyromonadaceae bacterium]